MKKYLINSFYFQKELFEKYLSQYFDFTFSPGFEKKHLRARFYVPLNIFYIFFLYISRAIRKYDIIHFNRPEAFFFFQPIPNQISIFEIHGFDIGVLGGEYLKDLDSKFKRFFGIWLDRMIKKRIIANIKKVDLFYCSTPDLVEPIFSWCGRKPIWLPNPIDFSLFSPEGLVEKLVGFPACFLAARLHGDKSPQVAIDIFNNVVKPLFPMATLHLLDNGELANYYKRRLVDNKTYFWYKYMDKASLAAKIRGADLVFGDFNIGALSMLPIQVMGLRKAIITLDRYEIIKKEIFELPTLTKQLLIDVNFRKNFIEKNYNYVLSTHDPQTVALKHYENLKKLF